MLYAPEDTANTSDNFGSVALDPNHTHFILVDNGSNGEFGVEIPFRAKLENELHKGHSLKYYTKVGGDLKAQEDEEYFGIPGISNSIPIVLVVVQGISCIYNFLRIILKIPT